MFASYTQTVLIHPHDSHLTLLSLRDRPVPPVELRQQVARGLFVVFAMDNASIEWWPSGLVKFIYTNGDIIEYPPKPTLADVIKQPVASGEFFQFKSDGSVYACRQGDTYYWGPKYEDENDNDELPEERGSDDDKSEENEHSYMECGCRC